LDDRAKDLSKCQQEVTDLKNKLHQKLTDVERLEREVSNQIGKLSAGNLPAVGNPEFSASKLLAPSPEVPSRDGK
jgi:hypothetical protein